MLWRPHAANRQMKTHDRRWFIDSLYRLHKIVRQFMNGLWLWHNDDEP